MEASAAFHRCVWQAFTRPAQCQHLASSVKSASRPIQHHNTRISSRTFTSIPKRQQDTTQQPAPATGQRSARNAVGAVPTRSPQASQPDPSKRIDLSSLQGIPSSYVPPNRDSAPTPDPNSATAKLNALWKPTARSGAPNRFTDTIRATDALSSSNSRPSPTFDIANLFSSIDAQARPGSPSRDDKMPLRLGPTLGRTLVLDHGRGIDLTRAFRMLEGKNKDNSVRLDMIAQKYHVRRGQKKKLDRSKRWREMFKAGFLAECARIRRMKNQGW